MQNTRSSVALRRSDYLSKEETESQVSQEAAKNYLGDSSAYGYVFSQHDTQEVVQTESSTWSSEEAGVEVHVLYKNWQDGFQFVFDKINKFGKKASSMERIEAYNELILLTEDFLLAARVFGRIIISEAHLPMERKTIAPLSSLGGVIGGQKFLVQGILFKFSSDDAGIFGPDDADSISAKISGHELKGVAATNSFADNELICPLMALIDFKGFRLIAMTQLPISKETLCVGSSDGGQTIADKSERLKEKLERLATSLNLQGHWIGHKDCTPHFLHTPVDLEGHVHPDGRMFLCDFSRLMPPEYPVASNKQAHLYQLLRREFVVRWPKPLSSDACSQFTKHQPQHKADNAEIEAASKHLYDVVIPAVAADLESVLQFKSNLSVTQFRMSSMLHSNGVNVRHLFRVYEHTKGKTAKALVLVEMVSRVIVSDLRRKLRETTRKLEVSMLEGFYLKVLEERLNLVFGNSPRSTCYWNKLVRKQLWQKFCLHLGPKITFDAVQRFPMLARTCSFKAASMNFAFPNGMSALHTVFVRLHQILGFCLKSTIEAQLVNFSVFVRQCGKAAPFRASDFEDLGVRVKHMNVVSYAKGSLYLAQGLDVRASDPKAAMRFLQMSIKNFEDALADNTSSKLTLRACARALFYYGEELARAEKHSTSSEGDDGHYGEGGTSPFLVRADLYFRRAILADPNDSESLFSFASFLDRTGKKALAEDLYKRAIRADPSNSDALKGYGDFLSDQGRFQESESQYLQAREASRLKGD